MAEAFPLPSERVVTLAWYSWACVRPSDGALALRRYALHFLVQSGISYCIMVGMGVEAMHR